MPHLKIATKTQTLREWAEQICADCEADGQTTIELTIIPNGDQEELKLTITTEHWDGRDDHPVGLWFYDGVASDTQPSPS